MPAAPGQACPMVAGNSGKLSVAATSRTTRDSDEDLAAAGDKLGKLLFETRVRIEVDGPASAKEQALGKLDQIAGAFGTFAGRVQVDTNIVWHKLRALVEGAGLASRALW